MATPQTPPAPSHKPLLTLSTLIDRHFVTIDGVNYDLRNADELSIVELDRMTRQSARFDQLFAQQIRSEEESAEYEAILHGLCNTILEAPDDVRAKLKDGQRADIVVAFTALSLRSLQSTRANQEAATVPPTGASSRRASRGSTGARRRRG